MSFHRAPYASKGPLHRPGMPRRWLAGGLLAVAAFVAGCGDETDPHAALRAGDGPTAAKLFQERADAAQPLEAAWIEAKLGRVEALATYDKALAGTEALELLKQHGTELGEKQIVNVAKALSDRGARPEAVAFLKATVELWPDSVLLDKVNHFVVQEMRAKGESDKLAGLGYTEGGGQEKFEKRAGSKTPDEKLEASAKNADV